MKYFSYEMTPEGNYIPQINEVSFSRFFAGVRIKTTWFVLYARIFNLSYPDFLRMVRDVYGATLRGKSGGYIHFHFKEKMDCDKFIKEVEKRFNNWIKY